MAESVSEPLGGTPSADRAYNEQQAGPVRQLSASCCERLVNGPLVSALDIRGSHKSHTSSCPARTPPNGPVASRNTADKSRTVHRGPACAVVPCYRSGRG